ncbi:CGNR zinc finger domain-containing protein [Nonomuraea sp. NPDC049684]|uniref:CGNR zinc finger domain-containing protein n=1 Tax=Nonomuraea sp. NPDC049684 TaxID=3364356 RepID=UPI00379DB599
MRIRPLRDEPMALDLVDTVWVDQGALLDQFDDLEGVRSWLGDHGLPGKDDLERVRDRLVRTRDALRGSLEGRGHDALNAVLAEGSTRPRVDADGPRETVVVSDPAWAAAWTAAADFVRLLRERPERLRKCANPACVLWFLDVSKNGSRRWCSMEVCGNRAKAGRFNQRHKNAV